MKKFLKITGIILASIFILLTAVFCTTFRDSFVKPATTAYHYSGHNYENWDEVFAAPGQVEVIPYFTGILETKNRYSDLDVTYSDKEDGYDVMGYFIRSQKHGDFLVDTGFDSSFYKNPPFGNYPSHTTWLLKLMNMDKASFFKNKNIEFYLQKHRIKPQKLFLTHLHIDHTAGIPPLDDDIEIIFGTNELNLATTTTAKAHFKNKTKLKTLDFTKAKQMPILGKSVDIFGDGSFWAINTPGHTESHISFLINSSGGPVLIAGDSVFFPNSLKYNLSHSFDSDKEASKKTRQKIIDFLAAYPQVKVYYGHDYDE